MASHVCRRGAPSSGTVIHGAFSFKKMCRCTLGIVPLKVSTSTELITIDVVSGLEWYAIPNGEPQPVQNHLVASLVSVSFLRFILEVNSKDSVGTSMNGRNAEPDSC